jgi:hypothetical protein
MERKDNESDEASLSEDSDRSGHLHLLPASKVSIILSLTSNHQGEAK